MPPNSRWDLIGGLKG